MYVSRYFDISLSMKSGYIFGLINTSQLLYIWGVSSGLDKAISNYMPSTGFMYIDSDAD